MRQALGKGMLTAAAATSILSLPGAYAFASAGADGVAADSPGVLSGNAVQAPVEVPVNLCGNTVDAVGALNPAFGNECVQGTPRPAAPRPDTPAPPAHRTPAPPAPPVEHPPTPPAPAALAETGSDALTPVAAAVGAGLLLGGGVMYRRGRTARR